MTDSRWQLKSKSKAPVKEIFASIQGEGLFVGERQIFVRFGKCNLACDYCDTDYYTNIRMLTSSQLLRKINRLHKRWIQAVSLTGGEPLLCTNFLLELLPCLKKAGLDIYLETNGTLPEELRKVIHFIDYVAMDIKLPSAIKQDTLIQHGEFLRILTTSSVQPGRYFVKIILTRESTLSELKKAFRIMASVSKDIPLVLQPVTTQSELLPTKLFTIQNEALKTLSSVRIIPQIHPLLKIR